MIILLEIEKKLSENKKLHVLLGGWRRQYVENRLKSENIDYSLFEKADLDTVKFLYGACDLYIVSSRYEGGPQAIIEAASMKIPIISTDVGIANTILSKDCIVNIEKDYYLPSSDDIEYAFNKIKDISISSHGKRFIKLFEEIK